jgi:hypothetical protein
MDEKTDPVDSCGTCHDLTDDDAKRVSSFMATLSNIFERANTDLLDALNHGGRDPESRRSLHEFIQMLIRAGDKVRSWSARPYTEPKGGRFRTRQHHPPPSIALDVTLNNGKRDYGIYIALAPDSNGVLLSCHEVNRVEPRKAASTERQEAKLRDATAKAVRRAAKSLHKRNSGGGLFGFALCTDDEVRTLYHVACTVGWVREKEPSYPDIGFVYVEWPDSAPDGPFKKIAQELAELDDAAYSSDQEREAARDRRFNALVLALQDCRNEGLFDQNTLLCAGSTDPSDHLESLAMHAVDALNIKSVADEFARALGYESYRSGRA